MNMLDELCGKVAPGLCRLSMNGKGDFMDDLFEGEEENTSKEA